MSKDTGLYVDLYITLENTQWILLTGNQSYNDKKIRKNN